MLERTVFFVQQPLGELQHASVLAERYEQRAGSALMELGTTCSSTQALLWSMSEAFAAAEGFRHREVMDSHLGCHDISFGVALIGVFAVLTCWSRGELLLMAGVALAHRWQGLGFTLWRLRVGFLCCGRKMEMGLV